ncbi:MAG TPA: molybdate ABC transporter substrate-binding protein [Pirellulales bacterium]|nr:molybdate ABC transporter substrate-binding protein [Pirellulales bacterium]
MQDDTPGWKSGWSVRLQVATEHAGKALLGPGRIELLEAIDRWRSISAAARQIGISYRHAWLLVQSVNEAAGEPLVESAVGGTRGGGANLTELGKHAVAVFRQLQQEIQTAAVQILPRVLNVSERIPAVHVAAAISLEVVLGQLLADYALRQPTLRVRAIYGASNELVDHLLAGAPCDLFLSADAAQVQRLRHAGLCQAKGPCVVARNGLAIVAPADTTIALRRPHDLLRPEIGRVALADRDSPLGRYTHKYLSQLGVAEPLEDRLVMADSSRGVLATLEAGSADVGLIYTSDAVTSAGVRILLRPRSEATVAEYFAVVPENAQSAEPAGRLLDFLLSADARRRLRACGFQPTKKSSAR